MPARRLFASLKMLNAQVSPRAVPAALVEGARWLGIEAAIIARYVLGDDSQLAMIGEGISAAYVDRYVSRRYDRASPLVKALKSTNAPLRWNLKNRVAPENSLEAEIEAGALAERLGSGLAVPVIDQEVFRGWVALVFRDDDALGAASMRDCQLVSLAAFHRLEELVGPNRAGGISLSSREREILLNAAQGQTTKHIARLLGISHRTVEFHLSNAARKLGTQNKSHTIAKAIGLRIIEP